MSSSAYVDSLLTRRRSRRGVFFSDTYAAFALVIATVLALIWANVGDSYETFWDTGFSLSLGGFNFEMSAYDFVDEFLMALFFFVIGLDVRREISIGELNRPSRALLPVVAAVGGLITPVIVFFIINGGTETTSAWGTVISTDTAFALGMLALVGPKNAPRLRLFLLAASVVDDIAALLVIAVVYTSGLNLVALGIAAVGLIAIFFLQRAGVWRMFPYLVIGLVVWGAVYASGIHATIAGVLIALLMPVYDVRRRDLSLAGQVFTLFRQTPTPALAQTVRSTLIHAIPLNQRLSASLPPYVSYIVVPLFALANAGIALSPGALGDAFTSTLTWGIILGLMFGKMIGIAGGAMLVMKLVPQSRLPGLDLPRLLGVGILTGMGFTISLLVVGLAIDDPVLESEARIGVLAASLFSLILAWVIFRLGDHFSPIPPPDGQRLPRPVDPRTDYIAGDPDAPVTLVVYAAMNRSYREGLARSIMGAMKTSNAAGRVRFVYRHRITESEDLGAALALEAAGRQGKFFAMHDALVQIPGDIDVDAILTRAKAIGLDVEALRNRMDGAADEVEINDDALDEIDTGGSEPVLFLQGQRISAFQNSWMLRRAIDAAEPEIGVRGGGKRAETADGGEDSKRAD